MHLFLRYLECFFKISWFKKIKAELAKKNADKDIP